jgi:hypothetical protein
MFNPFTPKDPQNTVYWRNPTTAEIRLGYGCTHYAEFTPDEHKGRRWFKGRDGLRYYTCKR